MDPDDLVVQMESALNPDSIEIVLYVDPWGWYDWTTARFWDDPRHQHFRNDRTEMGRSHDLMGVLEMQRAYNKMMHGQEVRQNRYE